MRKAARTLSALALATFAWRWALDVQPLLDQQGLLVLQYAPQWRLLREHPDSRWCYSFYAQRTNCKEKI